jgi:hypothetical protein
MIKFKVTTFTEEVSGIIIRCENSDTGKSKNCAVSFLEIYERMIEDVAETIEPIINACINEMMNNESERKQTESN